MTNRAEIIGLCSGAAAPKHTKNGPKMFQRYQCHKVDFGTDQASVQKVGCKEKTC